MLILPAIDLKGGKCVRLFRGDFSTAEQVAKDPVSAANRFRKAGAKWIHVVDLDGAKAGKPVHSDLIFRIARESGLHVETGGGIRTMKTAAYYLKNGISRVILGTAAILNPEFVRDAVGAFGDRIAAGIDSRNGMAAGDGWTRTSAVSSLSLAKNMESLGVKYIVFTDIARDGTLSGPNLRQLELVQKTVSCRVIASGGVSSLNDIENLKNLGLYGAICGKALYSGSLDLKKAILAGESGNAEN